MYIVNSLYSDFKNENKESQYSYRMIKGEFVFGQAFGIEIERQDLIEGEVVRIERDSISNISNREEKVKELLDLVYKYQVSPVHLVDILGEYVDKYVFDFNIWFMENKITYIVNYIKRWFYGYWSRNRYNRNRQSWKGY